jgi:hypothetical protein
MIEVDEFDLIWDTNMKSVIDLNQLSTTPKSDDEYRAMVAKKNKLCALAHNDNRTYVTVDDCLDLFESGVPASMVILNIMAVASGLTGFSAVDIERCISLMYGPYSEELRRLGINNL